VGGRRVKQRVDQRVEVEVEVEDEVRMGREVKTRISSGMEGVASFVEYCHYGYIEL